MFNDVIAAAALVFAVVKVCTLVAAWLRCKEAEFELRRLQAKRECAYVQKRIDQGAV